VKRLATAALVVLAACGGSRPRSPMSDGERTYLAKCTSCHSAYQPSDHTPAEWSAKIDEMERNKRVQLSPAERALILAYLSGR
jgi:hypothetical protein